MKEKIKEILSGINASEHLVVYALGAAERFIYISLAVAAIYSSKADIKEFYYEQTARCGSFIEKIIEPLIVGLQNFEKSVEGIKKIDVKGKIEKAKEKIVLPSGVKVPVSTIKYEDWQKEEGEKTSLFQKKKKTNILD